jgi:hypothetical protein
MKAGWLDSIIAPEPLAKVLNNSGFTSFNSLSAYPNPSFADAAIMGPIVFMLDVPFGFGV